MNAVQTMTLVCALPVAIILCYLLQSATLLCRAADTADDDVAEYPLPIQPEFGMPIYGGVFNVVKFLVSFGKVNAARVELGMHKATQFQVAEFFKGIVVPGASLRQVLGATYPQRPRVNFAIVTIYGLTYYAWAAITFALFWLQGLSGLSWTLLILNGFILGMVRSGFREHYNIRSNAVADIVGGIFFWSQVLTQMRLECVQPAKPFDLQDKLYQA
jgi:hypothetical protein